MKQTNTARMSRQLWVVLLSLLVFTILFGLSVLANDIQLSPSSSTLSSGETFTIDININATEPVKSFECSIHFNTAAFTVQSIGQGDYFGNHSTFFNDGTIDNTQGTVTDLYGLILGPGNVSGNGTLLTMNCQAKSPSSDISSTVNLSSAGITDETGYLTVSIYNTSLLVEADETSPPSNPSGGGGGGGGFIPPAEPETAEPLPPETPLSPTGPTEIFTGVEKTFTVSSWDPDGNTIRFKMDWGDGTLSAWSSYVSSNMTVVLTHQWNTAGNYTLKVLAEDDTGLSSDWSEPKNVRIIKNQTIVDQIIKNVTVKSEMSEANDTVEFKVSDLDSLDPFKYSFEWDFGDGSTGTGFDPDHQYSDPGEYTVKVTITDKHGNTTVKTFTVTVPETAAGSSTGLEEISSKEGFVSWWILMAAIIGAVIAGIIIFFRFFTFIEVDE